MRNHSLATKRNNVLNWSSDSPWSPALLLEQNHRYQVYYAPFEYINRQAKVVIVGITPGITQAGIALSTAKQLLAEGKSLDQAQKSAKNSASFGGPMRNNLVGMLDHIGLNAALGLASTEMLFDSRTDLVHFTSILRYPVLDNGKMLSDAKPALKDSLLNRLLMDGFMLETEALPDAIYVPLGKGVADVLQTIVNKGAIHQHQILMGLPHPSGANAERIAYFLGNKDKEKLSTKTNADKIDAGKASLIKQVTELA